MEVTFTDDAVHFAGYEFPGASVFPAGVVAAAQIRDVDPTGWPPEIRTLAGETLFVPGDDRLELESFCGRAGIARMRRRDVWCDLLEPFLDTLFTDADDVRTATRLREAGLSADEVADIRRRFDPLMTAYNIDGMVWEWIHLGLWDLLHAANGPIVPRPVRDSLGDPAALYAWAMAIADRGPIEPD